MMHVKKILLFIAILFLTFSKIFPQYSLTVQIADGIIFHKLELRGPIAVQYLEVDLTKKNISVETAIANDYLGNGGERVSELCERLNAKGYNIIAAVNGDFFGGKPAQAQNSMIVNGEFAKGNKLDRSEFALSFEGKPFVEKFKFDGEIILRDTILAIKSLNMKSNGNSISIYNRFYNKRFAVDSLKGLILLKALNKLTNNDTLLFLVEKYFGDYFLDTLQRNEYLVGKIDEEFLNNRITEEDTLKIYLGTIPSVGNIKTLIGGLPRLVIDGIPIEDFNGVEGLKSKKFIGKNPRTAVGFNEDSTKLFIVTVDGRQTHYSLGMTLPELAKFMKKIGCYQAVNLDGGGSTTMWVNGKIENSPSDKEGERPVHNALIVRITK